MSTEAVPGPLPAQLVVVGMSAREVQARERLLALAEPYGGRVAFLQLGEPSLSTELTRLADVGADRVVLAGVSLGTLAPAVSWLRRVAAYWWRGHGGRRPAVDVATALVTPERDLAQVLAEVRPLTGEEPGLASPAWEQVTAHRHQVLVCRGPRCTAMGSDRTAEAVVLALMAADLGDDDVLVTHTGCQLPCNHAPVVSVQPDDVWYGGVDPDAARVVVAEHLVGGTPDETHRLARRPRPLR